MVPSWPLWDLRRLNSVGLTEKGAFFLFHARSLSLLPLFQPAVFHNVLNPSAGHSYDTSKSLLLAKCQRMKCQQTQAPWEKTQKRTYAEDERSRAGRIKLERCRYTTWKISQRCKEENTEPNMAIDRWNITKIFGADFQVINIAEKSASHKNVYG